MPPVEKDMAVRLLYSLDHEQSQFVAKPSTPFRVSVHSEFNIGFCRLDQCLSHLVAASTDLSSSDYGVFSADVSEEGSPLTSHGKLQSTLNTTVENVCGLVKTNLLGQSMFEVRLHFKKLQVRLAPQAAPQAASQTVSFAPHKSRMPPSSPPPAKRCHTLPSSTLQSEDDLQIRPSFFNNTGQFDGPLIRTTFNPSQVKRRPQEPKKRLVPRCNNCGCFSATVWRWSDDNKVLCNACGLWPRSHKGQTRPASKWEKKKEKNPERWRVQPEEALEPGQELFACYEVSDLEYLEANRGPKSDPAAVEELDSDSPASTPMPSSPELGPEMAITMSSQPHSHSEAHNLAIGSMPVLAGRQETIADKDKENQPPGSMTPTRPAPQDQPDSHHKWMARYIHSQEPEHDIFEAFMQSPSKHTRQLDIELSSALSSSPPTSSTVYDPSEAELGNEWFKTRLLNESWLR